MAEKAEKESKTMEWATIAALIIREGLPVAISLGRKWTAGNPPTAADWDELEALSKQKSPEVAKQVLTELGIPLDSEKAQEILKLVSRT